MSLRAKLTWAFVVVALVALIPAGLILNWGMYTWFLGPNAGMGPGRGMGQGGQTHRMFMQSAVRWSAISSVAALGAAGLAGIWTAGRITRSLSSLRDAAQQMDLRDLSRRVPVEGEDEIADLARSFNTMADRLEKGERSRRQLLADVAHELRHPLAVMQGNLELVQEGKVPLEAESLLPLQDEVIRLTRLVGDLRDLSLAEVGTLSLHLGAVNLVQLLDALQVNLQPVAEAKEIRLTAAVAADLPVVQADGDRLRQVLVNLIANALHYTSQGGQVEVRAWHQDNRVFVQVCDSGPGIAPEDLPHIFDRFYRADKSRSRGTGGTGLGLAIVRSLVELHGGTVRAQSKPGDGTCFEVMLPVKAPDPKIHTIST